MAAPLDSGLVHGYRWLRHLVPDARREATLIDVGAALLPKPHAGETLGSNEEVDEEHVVVEVGRQ